MVKSIALSLSPAEAHDEVHIENSLRRIMGLNADDPLYYHITKRSLDARTKIRYSLQVDVDTAGPVDSGVKEPQYLDVSNAPSVHIIGAGPAGIFAALKCIELGLKPIVIERGKDVRARRRDLAKLNKEHIVNPESNYCFGEGGAGTYSDGKLYTRSKKRGNLRSVLETLVSHGAQPEILVDAHPHIGTNKLPGIITAMRETIEQYGGEVLFEQKLTDLSIEENQVKCIQINGEREVEVQDLILATGHSARDIFMLLHDKKVRIEQKSFSLGVRIEHPQELIDKMQYRRPERGEHLPPASYSLVCQAEGRGVYSFCMCPGGVIAPCATAPGEVVTNGWSPSKRNNPYANSGMVVEVKPEDLEAFGGDHPLAGLRFQASVEQAAWQAGGESQVAPAQRMMDFLQDKRSADLPECSYYPGLKSVLLSEVLPPRIHKALKVGLKIFGERMRPYLTNEAVLVATESRSSSPVRIPRDKETLQHLEVSGLYPCGEGAGYAGGIVSAAVDGQRCVEQIAVKHGTMQS